MRNDGRVEVEHRIADLSLAILSLSYPCPQITVLLYLDAKVLQVLAGFCREFVAVQEKNTIVKSHI